ncbi:MAG TPA: MFS transporter [Kofleriaceae bacterium]|nr:MFS transporter [Kofleriaceae bacterium]
MIRRPTAILALLTGLNFLNYMDRTLVAAVLPRIQDDLGMSNFEGGLLATVFLLGYFVTAPAFGARADRGPRKGLIALGVVVWSVATAASGLAGTLWTMLAARAVVGVGEASYATLAPTIIDDLTPPEQKGRALAIFYLATPLGSAVGYVMGGAIEKAWGWRAVFYVAGGPGVLLALLCLLVEEPARTLATRRTRATENAGTLARIPLFRRAVLGYCAETAAVGAFAYWAPKYLHARFALALDKANYWFGTVTVVAGAIGTVLGGRLADRALRRHRGAVGHDDAVSRRGSNELLRICAIGAAIAAPFALAAFLVPSPAPFFALVAVVEIGVFMSASPINAAFLRTVPAELRASAMAVSIFAIHMFGDLGSPPGVGLLLDVTTLVAAMMALPALLALAAFLWWPRAREA